MQRDEILEGLAIAGFMSQPLGKHFRRGDRVRAPRAYMEQLLKIGVVDPKSIAAVNNKPVGPREQKPAGPSERKRPEGDAPKKSSGAPAGWHSSSAPGAVGLSSFWAAGRVSLSATA